MQELSDVLLPEPQSQVIGLRFGKLQPFSKQKCMQTPHFVICTFLIKQLSTFDVLCNDHSIRLDRSWYCMRASQMHQPFHYPHQFTLLPLTVNDDSRGQTHQGQN